MHEVLDGFVLSSLKKCLNLMVCMAKDSVTVVVLYRRLHRTTALANWEEGGMGVWDCAVVLWKVVN